MSILVERAHRVPHGGVPQGGGQIGSGDTCSRSVPVPFQREQRHPEGVILMRGHSRLEYGSQLV